MPARLVVAALVLTALPAAPASGREKPAAPPSSAGRYIVVYERSAGAVDRETAALERERGFAATRRFHHALRGFAARLAPRQVSALRADPDVAAVVPDRPVHIAGAALEAGEALPTGIRRIGAAAQGNVRGASTAAVAVVDTGIDLGHPDLNVAGGTDCTGSGTDDDGHGHGTHVAGIIGARNNGSGVVGVAPGTPLYAVRVLDADGSGSDSNVLCGLDWVAEHAAELKIRVVNMSLGGLGTTAPCGTNYDPLHDAVCHVTHAGVSVVVAAGNDGWDFGTDLPNVPAAYPEVLTVTAMSDADGAAGGIGGGPDCWPKERDDVAGDFSNFAVAPAEIEHTIAAPGVCIVSTYKDGQYAYMSGTSMAAPHVAGEVALCLGEDGSAGPCAGLTPAQIIAAMRSDAAAEAGAGVGFAGDPDAPQGDRYYGYLGRAPGGTIQLPQTSSVSPPAAQTAAAPTAPATPATTAPAHTCRVQVIRRRHVHRVVIRRRVGRRIVRRVVRRVQWHRIRRLHCS